MEDRVGVVDVMVDGVAIAIPGDYEDNPWIVIDNQVDWDIIATEVEVEVSCWPFIDFKKEDYSCLNAVVAELWVLAFFFTGP